VEQLRNNRSPICWNKCNLVKASPLLKMLKLFKIKLAKIKMVKIKFKVINQHWLEWKQFKQKKLVYLSLWNNLIKRKIRWMLKIKLPKYKKKSKNLNQKKLIKRRKFNSNNNQNWAKKKFKISQSQVPKRCLWLERLMPESYFPLKSPCSCVSS
jgi:hypothetical protein